MNVTQLADKKIEELLGDSGSLRVTVNGGGCNGFTVDLSKTDGIKESDIWLNANLVTDSISEGYLSKATLDWIDDLFSPTFKFKIPNTRSCGCGNSFTLEDT
jgi:iron-sulfur cluster assembly accessory protein